VLSPRAEEEVVKIGTCTMFVVQTVAGLLMAMGMDADTAGSAIREMIQMLESARVPPKEMLN